MRAFKSGRNGQVVVMVALFLVVLLLFVGIAIDVGISYGVKAKLNSAADGAALAAGRALGEDGDDPTRIAKAQAAALKFFNANFPAGYMGATPTFQTPAIVHNANGSWDITVPATASVPTIFLRLIGRNTFEPAVVAVTHRRDLDMAFVLDTTGSLSSVFSQVKTNAVTFLDKFIPTSDRLALLHFAYGATVDDPIRTSSRGFDRASMVFHINSFSASGNTNYSEAFWRGRDQLDSIPAGARSSLRVIVFFSDGSPNSFSSTFKGTFPCSATPPGNPGVIVTGDSPGSPSGLSQLGSVRYVSSGCSASSVTTLPAFFNLGPGIGNTTFHVTSPPSGPGLNPRPVTSTLNFDNVNNAARNLAEEMASKARDDGIYVYTIGLGYLLTVSKSWGNHERGDTVLKNMANDPSALNHNSSQPEGLYCFAADISQLNACFDAVASQILRLTK